MDCIGIWCWLMKKLWILVRRFLDSTYILWPTFLLADFTVACGNPEARKDPIHASLVVAMAAHASREFGRGLGAEPDLSKALCDLCRLSGGLFADIVVFAVRALAPLEEWSSIAGIQVSLSHVLVTHTLRRCSTCRYHVSEDQDLRAS